MVLNIINKKLSEDELSFIKLIKASCDIVNVDFSGGNDSLVVKVDDIINQQRDILSYANMAESIVIWGRFAPHQLSWRFLRSLLNREHTYFAAIDKGDYDYYLNVRDEIPQLLAGQVNKFLVVEKKRNNEYLLDEIKKQSDKSGNNFLQGITEIFSNRQMIFNMAKSIFKQETINTTLGTGWHFIRDLIFFVTYILFMLFIRGNSPIDNMPAIVYLLTGLVAWYFLLDVMNSGVACIKQSAYIIKKIRFPVIIIPIYSTLSILYRRIVTYCIVTVVIAIYLYLGKINSVNLLLIIYYTFSMFIFAAGFNLVISGFVSVSKDFFQLYKAFTRILIYLNPVFWNISFIKSELASLSFAGSEIVEYIFDFYLAINPTVYILSGYREAFGGTAYNSLLTSSIFWIVVLTLYVVGFNLQSKLRRIYADVL